MVWCEASILWMACPSSWAIVATSSELSLVIQQHPGGEIRRNRPAESATAFPLAHFAVEVALFEHLPGQFFYFGSKE
jgi:hypothetical protein